MFGDLNREEVEQLLGEQLVGRIGCHADNMTYVVPISYAYENDVVYAHSFDGMKMNLMRKNPQVCFEVDDTSDLANWRSVICWGEFEELSKEKDKELALQVLNNRILPVISSATMRMTPEWPFPANDKKLIDGIFFRIKITRKTGRFERSEDQVFFCS